MDCFKGGLIAHGYFQHEGIHYEEMFSLVIKPIMISAILSIATSL